MRALICDMCSSNNMVKQDGLFVCQSCGTKYSVEEARRMMFDGPIEIEGSVKLDRTEEFENLAQLARESFVDCLFENALQNSRDALIIFADDLEMTVIQFLARFANEGYFEEIPLYCKNGIVRINLIYDKLEASFDDRRDLLVRIKKYGNIVCNYKVAICNAAIEEFKTQKYDYNDRMMKEARQELFFCKAGTSDERRAKARIKQLEKIISHNEDIQFRINKALDLRSSIEDFRRSIIRCVDLKLKALDREEEAYKASVIDAYWNEHPAEKNALDTELLALKMELKEIIDELVQLKRRASALDDICKLGNTPLQLKKNELSNKISRINREKNRLGFCRFIKKSKLNKEIRRINREIPSDVDISEEQNILIRKYRDELKDLKNKINELSSQRDELNGRILIIQKELNLEI
ncbi:MAG: hypothetical protein MJ172_04410 [Clostridia bacterium]|nr:hypothetical protein [Clostridia bacterium]